MRRYGIALPSFVALLGAFAGAPSNGLVILESTAAMELTYDGSGGDFDLPDAFAFEESAAQLFLQTLQQDDALGEGNEALSVTVAVQASSTAASGSSTRTVLGTVTCVYLSYRIPADLDTALMRGVNATALSASFPNAKVSFRPSREWQVLDKYQDDGLTAASKGLLAATVVLSVVLVAVSAVLLHITGGWSVCQQRVCNCLFEEVEYDGDGDDNYNNQYGIEPKDTFQVDGSVYGDDNDNGGDRMMASAEEDQSVATGMQTNPSGVLGVQQRDNHTHYGHQRDAENPAAGLGILGTPAPRGEFDYGDETPMSTSDRPLGITSMRELPQSDNTPSQERGGLAHMIMERLTHYSGASNHHTVSGDAKK